MALSAALHDLRHLAPADPGSPESARCSRCVFEPPPAGTQDYPSTFAKRHAVGFLQPLESVGKVGSATFDD
jgi:hypothetical protein